MRIAFLLLHDQRFSGWRLNDFLFSRYHFAKDYAERTSKAGNDAVLYTFHQEVKEAKEYVLDGYAIRVLPVSFRFPPFLPIGNSHNFRIVDELNRGSFDVVHVHNYYFWSLALVALAKRLATWGLVGQYHGEPELQTLGKYAHRCLFNPIDRFLVSTREEVFWLKKLYVDLKKVIKFPNVGVDTSQFRKVGNKEDVPHFIYVGRMTFEPRTLKEKDPWIILDVAKSLKKYVDRFKILMVGDGLCLEALKHYSKKIGLEKNVEFLGYKPHDLLPRLYSKCLFSFTPLSMWDLNPFWDGALKESLACETAVVGFNSRIQNYEQAKRRFGLLLPTHADRAAEILSVAVKHIDYLMEAGVEGREFIERCCSWENVIRGLLEVYRNLLSNF